MTKGRIWNPSHTSPAHSSAIDACTDYTFKLCLHPLIAEALEMDNVLNDTSTTIVLFLSPLIIAVPLSLQIQSFFFYCKD